MAIVATTPRLSRTADVEGSLRSCTNGEIAMKNNTDSQRWFPLTATILGAALLVWGVGATYIDADTAGPAVARVEEDWELVVAEPDVGNNGPQVTCTISPLDMATGYAALDINYHTQPGYVPGGLQMHIWNPNDPIVTRDFPANGMLADAGETITWTQTMTLNQGRLTFQVVNGQSQTWGKFGSAEQATTVYTSVSDLNGYDPQVSLANSGISFASNLVSSLKLKAVRKYDAAGKLIWQSAASQNVYPKE
jgi:hypothetical protein